MSSSCYRCAKALTNGLAKCAVCGAEQFRTVWRNGRLIRESKPALAFPIDPNYKPVGWEELMQRLRAEKGA